MATMAAQGLRLGAVLSDSPLQAASSSAAGESKGGNFRQQCRPTVSRQHIKARASAANRSNDLASSDANPSSRRKQAPEGARTVNAVKEASEQARNAALGSGSVGVIEEEKPAPTALELALTEAPVKTLEEEDLTKGPAPEGRSGGNGSLSVPGTVSKHPAAQAPSDIEVDAMAEADLKENGFRSTRRTKLMCTIGPACCELEQLEALAIGGMNVARLNMCHGTHAWHREIIRRVRELNKQKGYSIAIMMDTEGSEIHMGDLGGVPSGKAEDGEEWVFTVRKNAGSLERRTIAVNYDGFVDDVAEGDEVVVDGGMVRFEVLQKVGPDVHCRVIDAGLLLPRANLTFWRGGRLVRERNAMLPTISSKDWIDIDFAIAEGVDFLAISFVKTPDVIKHLRSYIAARSPNKFIALFSKIESSDSLKMLPDIIAVSDGAMVARGDLGAQIPLEQVPSVQQEIVHICRQLNKPVIVASQLLESMIEFPTPTRAEVADISEAVRQRADALMLSGESAMGLYPEKALGVLRTVATRIEAWCRGEKHHESMRLATISTALAERVSEQVCNAASQMANRLDADAIFVYTKRGYMASLLSRNRPDCPIFAFTDSQEVRQRLNLYWGLIPFRLDFSEDMEGNLQRTFVLLKARGMMKSGDLIVAVSDLTTGTSADMLQSIQIRKMP